MLYIILISDFQTTKHYLRFITYRLCNGPNGNNLFKLYCRDMMSLFETIMNETI